MQFQVPSHDDSSREASRHNTHTSSGRPSPHPSPRVSSMHSPHITPAATRSRETPVDVHAKGAPLQKVEAGDDPAAVTPQISPPATSPSTTNVDDSRPGSSEVNTRPTSRSTEPAGTQQKHHGNFSIGPTH